MMPQLPLRDTGRTTTVTITRPVMTLDAATGRQSQSTPTTVATIRASIEEATGRLAADGVLRGRPGVRVNLALQVYTNAVATDLQHGDVATLTYLGRQRSLEVDSIERFERTLQFVLIGQVKE